MVPRSTSSGSTSIARRQNLARMAESDHSRSPSAAAVSTTSSASSRRSSSSTRPSAAARPIYGTAAAAGVRARIADRHGCSTIPRISTHMVFVIDEYGEIQGMVTLQDVLEAVPGEFQPQGLEEAWAVHARRLVAARRHDPDSELKDRLELKSVPEEDRGPYHTLSGMVMCCSDACAHRRRVAVGRMAPGGRGPRRQAHRQGAGDADREARRSHARRLTRPFPPRLTPAVPDRRGTLSRKPRAGAPASWSMLKKPATGTP